MNPVDLAVRGAQILDALEVTALDPHAEEQVAIGIECDDRVLRGFQDGVLQPRHLADARRLGLVAPIETLDEPQHREVTAAHRPGHHERRQPVPRHLG